MLWKCYFINRYTVFTYAQLCTLLICFVTELNGAVMKQLFGSEFVLIPAQFLSMAAATPSTKMYWVKSGVHCMQDYK